MSQKQSPKRHRAWHAAGLLVGAAVAAPASHQTRVPTFALTRPGAVVAEPFTRMFSAIELPDGRVLATDSRERVVRLLDLTRGTTTTIARNGSGPREYLIPKDIVPMPGDSIWISDPVNSRWFVVSSSGEALGNVDVRTDAVMRSGEVFGSDMRGALYLTVEGRKSASPIAGSSGSAAVVRWRTSMGRVDTLVALRRPVGRLIGAAPLRGGLVREVNTRPLAAEDVAAVAPDGDVLVLRAPAYQLERWRDGRRLFAGAPIAHQRLRVTMEEKRAFVRSLTRPGQVILWSKEGIRPAPEASPDMQVTDDAEIARLEWPDVLPPFRGPLRIDPRGYAWIQRVTAHTDSSALLDVLDERGTLVAQVRLAHRSRLVGFGRNSVYVVREDEDQLQFLERFDAPAIQALR